MPIWTSGRKGRLEGGSRNVPATLAARCSIVVVGDGRAKGGIEIAALVTGGHLDERALDLGEDCWTQRT